MMGGGGSSYFPRSKPDLERLIQKSKEESDRERLDSDVNKLLRQTLSSFERDPEKVQDYLKKIGDILKDEADIEQFLFGGSVAKHTYVDGLSDVDALVILKDKELAEKSPKAVLDKFCKSLQDRLTYDTVRSVEKGELAVTVTYRDGAEIQLLPALLAGKRIAIPGAAGKRWNETNPMAFRRTLTQANTRLDGMLVPTIKLVKSIISGFPAQKRLTGYHIESLSVETVKGYRGPKTIKAVLIHIFEQTSNRVIHSISDITGQSTVVDSYLGKSNSEKRRIAADALAGVARRLNAAKTVDQWKKILKE